MLGLSGAELLLLLLLRFGDGHAGDRVVDERKVFQIQFAGLRAEMGEATLIRIEMEWLIVLFVKWLIEMLINKCFMVWYFVRYYIFSNHKRHTSFSM